MVGRKHLDRILSNPKKTHLGGLPAHFERRQRRQPSRVGSDALGRPERSRRPASPRRNGSAVPVASRTSEGASHSGSSTGFAVDDGPSPTAAPTPKSSCAYRESFAGYTGSGLIACWYIHRTNPFIFDTSPSRFTGLSVSPAMIPSPGIHAAK